VATSQGRRRRVELDQAQSCRDQPTAPRPTSRRATEALRQYDLCRTLLRDRVGLAPSPAIEAAIEPLRA
jgi:hypothetical protein